MKTIKAKVDVWKTPGRINTEQHRQQNPQIPNQINNNSTHKSKLIIFELLTTNGKEKVLKTFRKKDITLEE